MPSAIGEAQKNPTNSRLKIDDHQQQQQQNRNKKKTENRKEALSKGFVPNHQSLPLATNSIPRTFNISLELCSYVPVSVCVCVC